jgi:putative ABC transport system permease protein
MAQLTGASSAYEITKNLRLLKGRFITRQDNRDFRPVAVISDVAAINCFGSIDGCVGKTITFSGMIERYTNEGVITEKTSYEFVIVGVYQYISSGISVSGNSDKRMQSTDVLVPFTYLSGDTSENEYNLISFVVKDRQSMPAAEIAVRHFIEEKYGSDPEYLYEIINTDEELKPIKSVISIITAAFVIISAVSLLVGGIGLMNTMLVSVTERTKEIGIKKALGAKKSSIRLQFLIESAVLCIVACSVGVFFGMLIGMIIETNMDKIIGLIKNEALRYFLENTPIHVTPSLNAILVSTLFSLGVGVIFGYYPANKGAKMQPVDALRYE